MAKISGALGVIIFSSGLPHPALGDIHKTTHQALHQSIGDVTYLELPFYLVGHISALVFSRVYKLYGAIGYPHLQPLIGLDISEMNTRYLLYPILL